ncbi:putative ATPase [Streptomyces sp. Amel2xB2]|uniref:ATP-binding protein n=1 Tax=Streptomyces sp. Amel2xB2 TaxID=1305829 RepID=UPI000DBA1DE9|nr:helix-turn-helix transcriptional regulator [Streptomyces sp. Amel2xB2]RAJ56471.1 putative ATPase [Streptomyces sp. Amel2xB2]
MVPDRLPPAGLSDCLVGRAREMAVLKRSAEAARRGQAGLVTLQGPPGIGKTSLLHSFIASDACREMTVLHGACSEIDAGAGYGGVRALFRSLGLSAEDAASSPLLSGGARRALPALATDSGSGAYESSAAYSVMHGLYWLTANLMAERPLLLALDDVHWCDERSLAWIDFLLRRSEEMPLLVVLAQRDEAVPLASALADVAARPSSAFLELSPLSRQDVVELVGYAYQGAAESTFVRDVAALPGGNPMLLKRLLLELKSAGVRPDEHGVSRAREIAGQVVSDSVRGMLRALPEWIRTLARAAAVLGDAPAERLGALAGLPPTLVDEGVKVLRKAEILAPDGLGLAHDLVRSAVLEDMDGDALAELRTSAALLLSDESLPPEQVANQLLLLPRLTAPWMTAVLCDAAGQAESRAAPEAAVRYLTRAREADPDSLALRLQLARCVSQTEPAEAVRQLQAVLESPLDVRTRAGVAVQFGGVCLLAQQSPAAVRVLEEVLQQLDCELGRDPGPADVELRTEVQAALLRAGADEKSTIGQVRERASSMPAPPGDTAAQRQLLAMQALLGALGSDDVEGCIDKARRAIRATGSPTEESLFASSFTLSLADEAEEALEALDRLLQASQRSAAAWSYVLALAIRAFVLHGIGALPEALADAQTSVGIIADERWGHTSAMPQIALAMVLTDLGEAQRAASVLDAIERPNLDRLVTEYPWYAQVAARTRWSLGDVEGGLELLYACGRSLDESGVANPVYLPWWLDAAGMLMDLGRTGQARGLAEHGSELAERWGTPRAKALAGLGGGLTTPGRKGIELLVASAEMFAGSPARGEHARAEFLVGRALLTEGDRRSARDHLRTAADLAQRCGTFKLGEMARTLLIEAGGRMRKMSGSPLGMLTGMERKVADLAAAGTSNRGIAEALFVTVRTVETHLTSAYRKLGVTSRADLAPVLSAREDLVKKLPLRAAYPPARR